MATFFKKSSLFLSLIITLSSSMITYNHETAMHPIYLTHEEINLMKSIVEKADISIKNATQNSHETIAHADPTEYETRMIESIVKEARQITKIALKNSAWVSRYNIIKAIEKEVRILAQKVIKEGTLSDFKRNLKENVTKRAWEIWSDMAYGIYKEFEYNGSKITWD